MSTNPLVTIAIPTFNRADGSMLQTVQAALSQTYANVEVLVSDNASSDNTQELISAIDDPRLRYVRHPENIGANNNFNSCVFGASGDYFMLLPDDDLIDSDFVKTCVDAIPDQSPVGLIRTGVRHIDANSHVMFERNNIVEGTSFNDLMRAWFSNQTSLYCCNTLLNTEQLRAIGGFNSPKDLFQDVTAQVQVAAALGHVGVQEVKASFRHHSANNGALSRALDWCEDSVELYKHILRLSNCPESSEFMQRASQFLCYMNYTFTRPEKSIFKRTTQILKIRSSFNPAAPASNYLWQRELKPAIQSLRSALKTQVLQRRTT